MQGTLDGLIDAWLTRFDTGEIGTQGFQVLVGLGLEDPQQLFIRLEEAVVVGELTGEPGHRRVFVRRHQAAVADRFGVGPARQLTAQLGRARDMGLDLE